MTRYTINEYLGEFICPRCDASDSLYYEHCPACDEEYIRCSRCSYSTSMENCTAVRA